MAAEVLVAVGPAERWVAGARSLLASHGFRALTLKALCVEVGATTGSFYHSFDSWRALTSAVLVDWAAEETAICREAAYGSDDAVVRLGLLARALSEGCARTAGAVRIWAGIDHEAAAVQTRVDEARHRIVLDAMDALLPSREAIAYANWARCIFTSFGMADGQDGASVMRNIGLLVNSAEHRRLSRMGAR